LQLLQRPSAQARISARTDLRQIDLHFSDGGLLLYRRRGRFAPPHLAGPALARAHRPDRAGGLSEVRDGLGEGVAHRAGDVRRVVAVAGSSAGLEDAVDHEGAMQSSLLAVSPGAPRPLDLRLRFADRKHHELSVGAAADTLLLTRGPVWQKSANVLRHIMKPAKSKIVVFAIAMVMTLALHVGLEGVDVNVEHDKAFDFKSAQTWAWNPKGAGDVIIARTKDDDPAAVKRKAEPLILDAVAAELMRRGLQQAASEPALTLTYYLLLTNNMTTQSIGQFLPATTAWGYMLVAPSTQSIKMMNQGALVLDLSAKDVVVWRGVAQARVAFEADDKKRESILREGVRDLFKRYPPKQ
jgi:Domain of unknown function (DUF4136)